MSDTATKVQHTPGEWHAKPETDYVPTQVWSDDGRQLADVFGEDRATRQANAEVMAAAPELYELLKLARPFVPTSMNRHGTLAQKESTKALAAKIDALLARVDGAA